MARISELHYSNAYANSSDVSEFLEVSLQPSEDPADFTVSFYQANGTAGIEIPLTHPDIQVTTDPDNGELVYVISADHFPILLTDPDGGGANNYEAYALTNTGTGEVIDFYDIGGGTQNITALDGAAAGAASVNLPVLVGPSSTTTTLQFNQPDPDTLTYETVAPGDTGVACFAAGTLIDTPQGPRPVSAIGPGDLVLTVDAGPQPVRWAGAQTVRGRGALAPVRIEAGAFGADRDVFVSPQHRVLVTGWQAELYFGEPEVLVPAVALTGCAGVTRAPCDLITYVHFMFDSHQLVTASGFVSESFLPGTEALNGVSIGAAEELFSLFPGLRARPESYGKAARPVRPVREAAVLACA